MQATCRPGVWGRSGGGAKGGAAPPGAGIPPQVPPQGSAGPATATPAPAAWTGNKTLGVTEFTYSLPLIN